MNILSQVWRVARMSPREAAVRLAQEVHKRADEARHLRGRPPALEPLSQTPHPEGRFFFDPQDLAPIVELLRARLPEQVAEIVRQADKIRAHRFDLLGYRDLDFGRDIDWRLDPVHGIRAPERVWFRVPFLDFHAAGDHKIIWGLNRHQHLVTLARAWLVTGRDVYVDELVAQWYHWREHNPYPLGINWASSLEVAFRSLAWLWVANLLALCPRLSGQFRRDLGRALGQSARHIEKYLSTYFAPNTHLLGEGVALFFVGTLCPEFRAARRWRELGWRIIRNESRRQVRADGMHFEQSVYYHVYALDFFLHARILAGRNGTSVPRELDETIERMAELLRLISHGGAAPRFGDDDGGRLFDPRRNRTEHLLDPLATAGVLYHRADFQAAAGGLREETLWLLGPQAAMQLPSRDRQGAVAARAPASGLYVMAGGPPPRALVIDAGPHGAGRGGHGHADALSLQLIVDGRHVLTDPGTFAYPWEKPERDRFRSSAAHNTLEVDGVSQAEPSGPFSWRRLPRTRVERWITGADLDVFSATHDGYRRLADPVTHRRWVIAWKSGVALVRDVAEGMGEHALALSWHIGPEFRLAEQSSGEYRFRGPADAALSILGAPDPAWTASIGDDDWSPAYGASERAPVLRYRARLALPAEYTVVLAPSDSQGTTIDCYPHQQSGAATPEAQGRPAKGRAGSLERVAVEHPGLAVYRYADGTGSSLLSFHDAGGPWQWREWESDAAFACLTADTATGEARLFLAGASYLRRAGRTAIVCRRVVERLEIRGGELSASDASVVESFDAAVLADILQTG